MSQAPILFSTPLVRAILDGRKTQTRRLPRGEVDAGGYVRDRRGSWGGPFEPAGETFARLTGMHPVGTQLWVRETWAPICCPVSKAPLGGFIYKADHKGDGPDRWFPSIHMKREAARLFLRITDARMERLRAITDDDIRAEGVEAADGLTLRQTWAKLWDSINAQRERPHRPTTWARDPWIIAYTFDVERAP